MIKRILVVLMVAMFSAPCHANSLEPSKPAHMQWWREARFGLFVHWGLSSLFGGEISWSRDRYGASKYDSLALRFNPVNFDADAWVAAAKSAGMRYIVLTAKHHDGFCLWDTRTTDHKITKAPYGRDICRQLADAAHRAGLRLGWYISVRDWKDPHCADPIQVQTYNERLKQQVRELLTDYGTVDLLWFDYDGWVSPADPAEIFALCKQLQPDVVINNRLEPLTPDESHAFVGKYGEYATPEQFVGSYSEVPWESCANLARSGQWAHRFNDAPRTVEQTIDQLMHNVGANGNLLLNVGPDSLGVIPPAFVERLAEVGRWVNQYAQAIYATTGGPLLPTPRYVTTRRGKTFYLTTFAGVEQRIPISPRLAAVIEQMEVLGPNAERKTARLVRTDRKNPYIELNSAVADAPNTVIRVDCRVAVDQLTPEPPPSSSGSIAYYASATASSSVGQYYHNPEVALDDDPKTAWVIGRRPDLDLSRIYGSNFYFRDSTAALKAFNTQGWLAVDLGKAQEVNRAVVQGRKFYVRSFIEQIKLQYQHGDMWVTVGEAKFADPKAWEASWTVSFPTVRAARWRLLIDQGVGYFGVSEFQLFKE